MHIGEEGLDMGFMRILFVENEGMAFGSKLPWLSPVTAKISLSVLRFVAIFAIIYYIKNLIKKNAHKGLITAVSLILAGAIGNLLDSMFYGYLFDKGTIGGESYMGVAEMFSGDGGYAPFLMASVVDMLQFTIRLPEWFPFWAGEELFPAIFNVADTAITVGVLMILFWQKKFFNKKNEKLPAHLAGNETVISQNKEEE